MIYLDTSAFIKLYLREDGSAEVNDLVVSQQDPLPVWHLMELEFLNAIRFKVFNTLRRSSIPSLSTSFPFS
jgi:predicted nucleic acid-binding protein